MQNEAIDGGRGFDWGRASGVYAQYRDIYPEEFYRRLVDMGLCGPGQAVLDLGTGTGVLPRNLCRYGATFTGVDVSANQIAAARRLSAAAGLDIDYRVAAAEDFDFPPDSFDVVTACQCFLYFDKAAALPNIHAVLRPGGHFAVIWMAWLPGESEIAAGSERLVLQLNPQWTGGGYTRPAAGTWERPDWAAPLFRVCQTAAFDVPVSFTRESWHGRMLACRGVGASSLSPEEIAAFASAHRAFLEGCPPEFTILHHVTVLDLAAQPAG